MKNIPKKIYLQTGDAHDGGCDDFDELDQLELTWCKDSTNMHDVEYLQTGDIYRMVDDLHTQFAKSNFDTEEYNTLSEMLLKIKAQLIDA